MAKKLLFVLYIVSSFVGKVQDN